VKYYFDNTLSYRNTADLTATPSLGHPLALKTGACSDHPRQHRLQRELSYERPISPLYGLPYAGQVYNQAPTLAWTGETGYVSDGVSPDSAASGSRFTFRVKFTDPNNNLPGYIRVLLDKNNDGVFEDTYDMAAADNTAGNTYRGRIYTKSVYISNIGSSVIRYKFEAADNAALAATGR
jgi:hypothetical protein